MLDLTYNEIFINETASNGYSPYHVLLDEINKLNVEADKIQMSKGNKVLFDYTVPTEDLDLEDWYNFYIDIDNYTGKVLSISYEYGMSGTECGIIEVTDETLTRLQGKVDNFFRDSGFEKGWKEYRDFYEGGY